MVMADHHKYLTITVTWCVVNPHTHCRW